MRVLGVDFGSRRIGIAVGESEFRVATPRLPLPASGTLAKDAAAIAELAQEEQVEVIALGQPLNEDDERMANICGRLGELLRAVGWKVVLIDESFTSVQAETNLQSAALKGSRRRRLRDGEAAAIILDRFFDEQASA